MFKTTVYLSSEQKQLIKRVARKDGLSEAEVIRAAVDSYMERTEAEPIWPESFGVAASGRIPAEKLDDWKAENWNPDW
jgi:hypothetical protein